MPTTYTTGAIGGSKLEQDFYEYAMDTRPTGQQQVVDLNGDDQVLTNDRNLEYVGSGVEEIDGDKVAAWHKNKYGTYPEWYTPEEKSMTLTKTQKIVIVVVGVIVVVIIGVWAYMKSTGKKLFRK